MCQSAVTRNGGGVTGYQTRTGQQELSVVEMVERWWWDDANFLPWLQRVYLDKAFQGYDPTADRDDDTPYDVDHIVPRSDWGCNWSNRGRLFPQSLFTEEQRVQLRWTRNEIGNSIGNKWLVDYASNRSWGDKSFQEKVSDIDGGSNEVLRHLLDVFPNENRQLWIEASPNGGAKLSWNYQRLTDFQSAIERRAAWLYRRLYEDLDFAAWMKEASSDE